MIIENENIKGMPSHAKIHEVQFAYLNLMNADLAKIKVNSCWACGWQSESDLTIIIRTHIIGRVYGGSNSDPRNFFLLCEPCHKEQPDGSDINAQYTWLLKHDSYIAKELSQIKEFNIAISKYNKQILDTWMVSIGGPKALKEMLMQGWKNSAGSSYRNKKANALWTIYQKFENWIYQVNNENADGDFVSTILTSLSALERETLRGAQNEGIKRALASGRKWGRKKIVVDGARAVSLYNEGKSIRQIALELNVKKDTIARSLKENKNLINPARTGVRAVSLYNEGKSIQQIALDLGVKKDVIIHLLKENKNLINPAKTKIEPT